MPFSRLVEFLWGQVSDLCDLSHLFLKLNISQYEILLIFCPRQKLDEAFKSPFLLMETF